jgi:hypothetical protein
VWVNVSNHTVRAGTLLVKQLKRHVSFEKKGDGACANTTQATASFADARPGREELLWWTHVGGRLSVESATFPSTSKRRGVAAGGRTHRGWSGDVLLFWGGLPTAVPAWAAVGEPGFR